MSLFGTRDELRQGYSDAWRKRLAGAPLTALEAMIADVIGLHPEYQPIIQNPAKMMELDRDITRAGENPFLHMGLHMAVREQISVDRPPGVRDLMGQLQLRRGDPHSAEHILMESLAEVLWEAHRGGLPPDEGHYLALVRRAMQR